MMIQKKWIRYTACIALLAMPVMIAGCGLFSQQTSKSIDPPQEELMESIDRESAGPAADDSKARSTLTVYLQDKNGYLAPIAVPAALSENETAARKALEIMVEGGAYTSLLPEDFRAMIPQGTQVLSYDYDKQYKVAKINLSGAFADYNALDERAIVEAITWTLTAMTGIEGVELYVDGELLEEMPQASFPIQGKLTRAIGINVETADGVHVANSSPVTLYFSAETINEEQYYVPVTRLVTRSDSAAHTAMEQFIQGPINKKELNGVILPNVEVTGIEEKDNMIVIDLKDEAYTEGQQVPSEMLEALVLSLTESTDADSVQIRINGETNLVDDNNKSYSEPVGRPHHVNALKS